jgi:hypothetical protein
LLLSRLTGDAGWVQKSTKLIVPRQRPTAQTEKS